MSHDGATGPTGEPTARDAGPEPDTPSAMPPGGTARPVAPGEQQPVLVVMGVSGSGKSTVAALLAGQLGWDLGEGDDLHPDENVQKMAAGHALTDEDRWPWLETVASWIAEHTMAGVPGIITCSALKHSYRNVLRGSSAAGNRVVFVFLHAGRDRLARRMTTRTDHFMPAALLDSQLSTLQQPTPDEDVLIVEAAGPPGEPDRRPAELAAEVIGRLGLRPEAGSSALGAPSPGTSTAAAHSLRTISG